VQHLGRDGYVKLARAMWSATQHLVGVVESRPELRLLARPHMNLFAFTTTAGDVFELADRLTARGWHVQPTYAFGNSPAHIHLTLDPSNAPNAARFGEDLQACLADLPNRMELPPEALGMLAALDGGNDGDGAGLDPAALMGALGVANGMLPSQSAHIHRILNAASPALREKLVVLFVGELFA